MIYKNKLNITMKNKILLLTAATSLLLGCVSGDLQDPKPQVVSEAKWKPVTKNNWDAATRGNTELIKKMLAEGMNVDIKDEEGEFKWDKILGIGLGAYVTAKLLPSIMTMAFKVPTGGVGG